MRAVSARARVKVDGWKGEFLVMSVDRELQTANLIPVENGELEEDVPFSRIRPLNEEVLEADADRACGQV